MFIISDLDGTLANIEHRRHFITDGRRDWTGFFRACSDDLPIWPVITVVQNLLGSGHRVDIWSGRSDEVRAETKEWLDRFGLGQLPLKMRQARDHTADQLLKESWLMAEPTPPDMVFDDRDKVVAMWRRHGIICAQVAPGNF